MTDDKPFDGWTRIDFRPDGSGWRAVYVSDTAVDKYMLVPVVGWLIEEQRQYDATTYEPLPPDQQPEQPVRRVVAGIVEGQEVQAVDESQDFWYLLEPGEPDPRRDDAAAEITRRAQLKEWAQRRKQPDN